MATAAHRAAGRVVDILELLATTRDGFALKDLSRRLSTPKSSLLPLLRTLTARGYLEHVRAGEYQLGTRALDLGRGSATHREVPELARPALAALMRRTGETVFLARLSSDGAAVVYVDKVESEQLIRYSSGVGDRRPLHATSSGRAILAFLDAERREELLRSLRLERYTDQTVSTLTELRSALAQIRRTGVSVNVGEVEAGASGISAPVFDRHGDVIAACTVGGPTERVRPRLRQLTAEVKSTARAISGALGYRHHPH